MAKVKILKSGETDIESTDIWRFCIHSDYPTQKVYASGQTTLVIPAGSNYGEKIITHSLGYAPIVMAMFETDSGIFVKVLGETKVSKKIQVMQFFAVNKSSNYIESRVDYHPASEGGTLADSYVSVNDIVRFTSYSGNGGVLPSPLQPNTDYYVTSILASYAFKISTTQGGSPVDITDGGGYYPDIFENITNPLFTDDMLLTAQYSVNITDTSVSFLVNPSINSPLAAHDVNIPVYYIILYDEI